MTTQAQILLTPLCNNPKNITECFTKKLSISYCNLDKLSYDMKKNFEFFFVWFGLKKKTVTFGT